MIIIITFILQIIYIHSILLIKFNRTNPIYKERKNITIGEFIIDYVTNDYKTYLLIGEPYQRLPAFLKTNYYGFYLSDEGSEKRLFKTDNSQSYKFIKEIKDPNYYASQLISESLYFDEKSKSELKKVDDFELIVMGTMKTPLCFNIGTQASIQEYMDKDISIFNTLHQKKVIKSYKFGYEIISDDELNLIIDYEKESNSIEYIKPIYNSYDNKPVWGLVFDEFILDNEINNDVIANAKFDINLGVIEASLNFYKIIKDYLEKYKINFETKNYKNDYDYETMECDVIVFNNTDENKIILKNFNMTFYHKELNYNFTLNYKDLFLEKENLIYFLVIFNKRISKQWNFGIPFLKKYNFVFDQDNKLIGFDTNKGNNDDQNLNNDNGVFKIILIVVLLCILVGIIFGVGILFGKKIFGFRKTKANELLDDDYEYSPKIN